jgi:hypothetical protein
MKGGDIMCCNTGSHHGLQRWGHQQVCACGCLGVEFPRSRFMTKKQQIANLEKHIEELQDEVKNVKEYISEMKKEI